MGYTTTLVEDITAAIETFDIISARIRRIALRRGFMFFSEENKFRCDIELYAVKELEKDKLIIIDVTLLTRSLYPCSIVSFHV